jgi:formate hydrogenlyase subunit 3/multisubunit Na+/H+ antiporter MnhD subunit
VSRATDRQIGFADWELLRQGLRLEPLLQTISDFLEERRDVMAHHRVRDNTHAGYVYLIMARFGTSALQLGCGMLGGPDGSYAFAAMRANHPSSGVAAVVLILVLLGAGSKAGLIPLHVWLPLAHPAAPSHISALMSGVMTKAAVYGFVRIVFDLLGPPAWWWSWWSSRSAASPLSWECSTR